MKFFKHPLSYEQDDVNRLTGRAAYKRFKEMIDTGF